MNFKQTFLQTDNLFVKIHYILDTIASQKN